MSPITIIVLLIAAAMVGVLLSCFICGRNKPPPSPDDKWKDDLEK